MMYYESELHHFGIPGQKWGLRRYQNQDGSLTSEGRVHYGVGQKMDTNRKGDSAVTRRVKNDYNNMSEYEFRNKYRASKETYRKRVNKYGDPYKHRVNSKSYKALKKLNQNPAMKGSANVAKKLYFTKEGKEFRKKAAIAVGVTAVAALATYGTIKYSKANPQVMDYGKTMFYSLKSSAKSPLKKPVSDVIDVEWREVAAEPARESLKQLPAIASKSSSAAKALRKQYD